MNDLKKIYEPITLAGKKVRNRIVLAPMGTRSNMMDGTLTDRCSIYLEERARGGAGLIIPELTAVKEGYTWIPSMQIYSDRIIPALARLADSVHGFDSRIIMQLALHGGRAASAVTHKPCLAPSAIESPLYKEIPHELTKDEILELVEDWRAAAIRTQRAGFDGVEVHGSHGYLLNEFISPSTNRRTDEFGGSLENRLRFPQMIVQAIRESCGDNFIIGFKMSAFEVMDGGVSVEDSVQIAHQIEAMGVDYLHVSATSSTVPNHRYTRYECVPTMYDEKNCLVPLAERIKNEVKVPVIAAAGIVKPDDAEEILQSGKADMVAIGRAFLADAHWGLKPQTNEQIRPCIGCMTCHKHTLAGTNLVCTVNPGLLREFRDLTMPKTSSPRKVLIIGGGPAGMEAAIQACDQGHQVTLVEKDGQLGGELIKASAPAFKYRTRALLEYYRQEIATRPIEVRFNCALSPEGLNDFLVQEPFDVVVAAVGAKASVPPIPGVENETVYKAEDIFDEFEYEKLGRNVVVIGAGKVGMEAAWLLADEGKNVHVVEAMPEVLPGDHPSIRATLLHQLEERQVKVTPECKVLQILNGKVLVEKDGKQLELPADSVLLAVGYRSDDRLYRAALDCPYVERVYEAGDCKQARGMTEAISEGYYIGRYQI